MTTSSGVRCDCCGDPYPGGVVLIQREDGIWEEFRLSNLRGSLALNGDGEDWLCPKCLRLIGIELQKWRRDSPERITAILSAL